jgi:hypothetical protein
MQYMIMSAEDKAHFHMRNDPVQAAGYWGAWTAYIGASGRCRPEGRSGRARIPDAPFRLRRDPSRGQCRPIQCGRIPT